MHMPACSAFLAMTQNKRAKLSTGCVMPCHKCIVIAIASPAGFDHKVSQVADHYVMIILLLKYLDKFIAYGQHIKNTGHYGYLDQQGGMGVSCCHIDYKHFQFKWQW